MREEGRWRRQRRPGDETEPSTSEHLPLPIRGPCGRSGLASWRDLVNHHPEAEPKRATSGEEVSGIQGGGGVGWRGGSAGRGGNGWYTSGVKQKKLNPPMSTDFTETKRHAGSPRYLCKCRWSRVHVEWVSRRAAAEAGQRTLSRRAGHPEGPGWRGGRGAWGV